MSRSALGALGMVYDLEDHSAKFKHLSIDRFTLMTTDSGHPAIPVTPKRVPGLKWPSPQQWGNYGVIILPSAESQYVAFMTSSPKLSEGTAQEPVEHPRADGLVVLLTLQDTTSFTRRRSIRAREIYFALSLSIPNISPPAGVKLD